MGDFIGFLQKTLDLFSIEEQNQKIFLRLHLLTKTIPAIYRGSAGIVFQRMTVIYR
jgi:hypothetical protein